MSQVYSDSTIQGPNKSSDTIIGKVVYGLFDRIDKQAISQVCGLARHQAQEQVQRQINNQIRQIPNQVGAKLEGVNK